MSMISIILLETVSIQKYVFSSNYLKVNLGASHLIKQVYEEPLLKAINDTFKLDEKLDYLKQWVKKSSDIPFSNSNSPLEIGYIGGGNAVLFCSQPSKTRELIENWTKFLLIETPSLQTAVVYKDVSLSIFSDDSKFKSVLSELYDKLAVNKNKYYPNTVLSKYGITADCAITGYSAEKHCSDKDINGYISSVAFSKLNASNDYRTKNDNKYKNILGKDYALTSRFDYLGQNEEKNYLAVVHIDGNRIGSRFKYCNNLTELRELSISIHNAMENSFESLLKYVIGLMPKLSERDSGFNIRYHEGRKILPIIPIIIGGDDITFITDGRLGLHLTEKFIDYLTKNKTSDNKPLSACAGIAIVKSKYPFYLAYKLSESLCEQAKIVSRDKGNNSSWLDFYISDDSLIGNLDTIRQKLYQVNEGNLNFGPYYLSGNPKDDEKDIKNLKNGIRELNKLPRNKAKELRNVIPLGKNATTNLIDDLSIRGYSLPKIQGYSYHKYGWVNNTTPYLDMIDLMEFYPEFLIEGMLSNE